MKQLAMIVGVGLVALSVNACSVEVHRDVEPVVEHEKLGIAVADQLTKIVGQRPDDVTCPDDLPVVVGASTRCVLTSGATRYGVTVSAASVDPVRVKV